MEIKYQQALSMSVMMYRIVEKLIGNSVNNHTEQYKHPSIATFREFWARVAVIAARLSVRGACSGACSASLLCPALLNVLVDVKYADRYCSFLYSCLRTYRYRAIMDAAPTKTASTWDSDKIVEKMLAACPAWHSADGMDQSQP